MGACVSDAVFLLGASDHTAQPAPARIPHIDAWKASFAVGFATPKIAEPIRCGMSLHQLNFAA
jgi:hypothetical protein